MQSLAGMMLCFQSGPDKLTLSRVVSRNSRTWDKNVSLSPSTYPGGLCPRIVQPWSLG